MRSNRDKRWAPRARRVNTSPVIKFRPPTIGSLVKVVNTSIVGTLIEVRGSDDRWGEAIVLTVDGPLVFRLGTIRSVG